jgi:hypothetical protein
MVKAGLAPLKVGFSVRVSVCSDVGPPGTDGDKVTGRVMVDGDCTSAEVVACADADT